MVASLRNISLKNVIIGPAPTPPIQPLFIADFSQYPDGPVSGLVATEYDPLYSSGAFGIWPDNAPTYDDQIYPLYWFGYTGPETCLGWYIDNGTLYYDASWDQLWLPLFIPSALQTNGIKITVRFIGTTIGIGQANPLPQFQRVNLEPGVESDTAEILVEEETFIYDFSDLDAPTPEDLQYNVPDMNGPEQEIVWTMNLAGRVSLFLNGNQLGPDNIPWDEPNFMEPGYVMLKTRTGDSNFGVFGYTYISVEAL